MKTHVFIQARMGSTRLPKKVLSDLGGRSMFSVLAERLRAVAGVDAVILMTSIRPENDPLCEEASRVRIPAFRGNEENLLDRMFHAVAAYPADTLVRVTADCPLLDPRIVEEALQQFRTGRYDMVSNVRVRSFPDGMDVEVFSRAALTNAWHACVAQDTESLSQFMSPTKYIHHSPAVRAYDLVHKPNLAHVRITVDFPEDLDVVRAVHAALSPGNPLFSMDDTVSFLSAHPEIAKKNAAHVCTDYGLSPEAGKNSRPGV